MKINMKKVPVKESKKTKKRKGIDTVYDDAFRTLMNECIRLLIPVVNEIFGKHYTGEEQIILQPNEHFMAQQDGKSQKRITDSSFKIIDDKGQEERFLIEVQSTADNSMIVRIFEYAVQIALDAGSVVGNKLTVNIPNASIIFLRSKRTTPDRMTIEMRTPGGKVSFEVPVVKVKSYTLADMFVKGLYFLLPFYIFNLENKLKKYESDSLELEKLKEEYVKFMAGLDKAVAEGKISVYYRRVILDMSKKVLEGLAMRYEKVQKGVKEILGGRVLEHEGKTILNQGIELGKREEKINTARRLRDAGMSDSQIHQFTDLSMEEISII